MPPTHTLPKHIASTTPPTGRIPVCEQLSTQQTGFPIVQPPTHPTNFFEVCDDGRSQPLVSLLSDSLGATAAVALPVPANNTFGCATCTTCCPHPPLFGEWRVGKQREGGFTSSLILSQNGTRLTSAPSLPPYTITSLYVTSDISCLPQQTGFPIVQPPTHPTNFFEVCDDGRSQPLVSLLSDSLGATAAVALPVPANNTFGCATCTTCCPHPPSTPSWWHSEVFLLHEPFEEFCTARCFTSCSSLRYLVHQFVVFGVSEVEPASAGICISNCVDPT